ncbi:hypothetical protein [Kribbella sp. NPDC055071]
MVLLTAPANAAPTPGRTPADRARLALGTALGIVFPTAVPLRDGRIWLTSRRDLLAVDVVQALEAKLTRRADDHVRDDRLLAEAVASLGAEVARVRGASLGLGAAAALDRFLHAPGVDQSRRDEAQAQLRVALVNAAADSPEAAARLRTLPGTPQPVRQAEIRSASQEIGRDAQLLGTTTPSGPPAPTTRARARVGTSHRRASRRQTVTRVARGTGLVTGPGGRPSNARPLDQRTALAALARMTQDDLGSSLTAPPVVDEQGLQAVVMMAGTDVPQHIRVEIEPTVGGVVAQGRLGTGDANQPHILRISPQLDDEQLRSVWTHQLSLMTQQLAAARAERPAGVLDRLRSAFSTDRQDRRLRADNAVYQLLVNDWQQVRAATFASTHQPNEQTAGSRRMAELERDIQGMAKTIRRRSGREPALPWVANSIAMPGASQAGFAAGRAQAAAIPAPRTPAHLRQQVVAQIAKLEASATDLDTKAAAKMQGAAEARGTADDKESTAKTEERAKDGAAAERARALRAEAVTALAMAQRNEQLASGYRVAAISARHALDGYQTLLAELDGGVPEGRIADLAKQAGHRVAAFEYSLDWAFPVEAALETGVPTGETLQRPRQEINAALAAHGIQARIGSGADLAMPMAEYRRLLSADGMTYTLGGDADDALTEVAEVRIRLRPRNLTEVVDHDYALAEQNNGTLGEGGISIATTDTHASSLTAGFNGGPLLAMAGVPVSVRGEASRNRSLAETGGASAYDQHGWVEVAGGESVLAEFDGELEIEVRKSPTEPWSAVETVDIGRRLSWVPSPYSVKATTETVSLEELGHAADCTTEFPRHTVTRINGLQSINDRLVAQAEARFGDLDRTSYNQISQLITKDPYRLLRDAAAPGGITRQIGAGGEPDYELTLEVVPIWRDATLDGESSPEIGMEEVLVDFAGANASQTYSASLTGTGALTLPVPGGPSVSVGRNVSRQGGQNVSTTSIVPSVQRYKGPTQGVLVGLQVKASLRKVSGRVSAPIVVEGTCEGRLRVPENDLLRTGARADKNAVRRNPDDSLKLDQQGRVLLRGDGNPPAPKQDQHLPPFHGIGANKLRGPGTGMVQNLQGADDAQRQALLELSDLGLVPPLDPVTLKPQWGKRGGDRLRRGAQQRNYERVRQAFLAQRIETGINQAVQGGLVVPLDEEAMGRTPRVRPFRLLVTPVAGGVTPGGTTEDETGVGLGISSRATQRTSGRSKSVPVGAGAGASDGPGKGLRGLAGRIGGRLNRTALGRSVSWATGGRVNRVWLAEPTAPLDRLTQDVEITFAEITDTGDAEPIATAPGSYDVKYDSALTRAKEPVFAADPKAPAQVALRRSIALAVDAGEPADRIAKAVSAIRTDSSAFLQLHTQLSPNSLLSNPEWMNGTFELPMSVVPGPRNVTRARADGTLLPQEFKVVIRGVAVDRTYVATSQRTTGDINFTMSDASYTSGTSVSGGVGVDGSLGPARADGSSRSGGVSVGRTGGTSQSTTEGQTTGEERLLINTGAHYDFIDRHKLVAEIHQNGEVVQKIELDDALVHSTMAERRALELYASNELDLPLEVVADAAERWQTDRLVLSTQTARGFVRRYRQDKRGATDGLAAEHSDDDLAAKLRRQLRAPESQATTTQERLQELLSQADQMADRRRPMHMAGGSYDNSLGSSQIEWIAPEGLPSEEVDLLGLIDPQIDEVYPEGRPQSLLLDAALDVNLSKSAFRGRLEEMLGVRGYIGSIEVPVQGQAKPDVLLQLVDAHFEDEITIEDVPLLPDGTPDIPRLDVVGAIQAYNYNQVDSSVTHTTTYSGSATAGGAGADGVSASGGVGTDRTRQDTAADGHQHTGIDRTTLIKMAMTKRSLVFRTRVVRLHNAGSAELTRLRWQRGEVDPSEIKSISAPQELRAELSAIVPHELLKDGPAPAVEVGASPPEHRPFRLPQSAVPDRAATYLAGEPPSDRLYDQITGHLGEPAQLGLAGLAEYERMISDRLKEPALKARFGQLMSAGGYTLPKLAATGNSATRFEVTIHATPLISKLEDGLVEGQVGTSERSQHTVSNSSSGNHLGPATVTGGFNAGVASASASFGEQAKEQSSNAYGTRLETLKIEEGQLVTVRIPVEYTVTVDELVDTGRGDPKLKERTQLPKVAKGEFYVKMLKHEYLEGLSRMEAGASNDAVLAGMQLQAVPPDLGPVEETSDYRQGLTGLVHQPYQPLLDAVDKAVAEERVVALLVHEVNGPDRKYWAFPNGTMAGEHDGGFASAVLSLDRRLVWWAESHDVPLRDLFNTTPQDGNFSARVAAALEKQGVPAAVLKGLDYATTKRLLSAPSSHEANSALSAGANRTITPSGHGGAGQSM